MEEAIGRSLDSLVERDSALVRKVVAADTGIDALELEIDQLCMEALALQQPMARDLRLITTAMKISTDLERVADHAVNICERAIELSEEPQLKSRSLMFRSWRTWPSRWSTGLSTPS